MNISVVGIGYVGLSNAILLAQHHQVIALDVLESRVEKINQRLSPIVDEDISLYLKTKKLNLFATMDKDLAYKNAEYIIIATPTNYDPVTNSFDTSTVEQTIESILMYNKKAVIIIKSTIPVGFTESMREKYQKEDIIFSPEFLREGKALYDNLYPSRIVVGDQGEKAHVFANLLKEGALKQDVTILYTGSTEAEAIKLFSNTYLAMRVSYFNELDTYTEMFGLNTKAIVEGISLDPRIGQFYNNPSFGYGGYCLPKDTKQLRANYQGIPQNIISAIVDSNDTRKKHIASQIMKQHPKTVGIYRLTMKTGSDNFRDSAIFDIITILKENHIEIVVYEPTLNDTSFMGFKVYNDFSSFKNHSDLIVANRLDSELSDIKHKVYTRDLYSRD